MRNTDLINWTTLFTATAVPDGSWALTALEPDATPRVFHRVTVP